LGTVDVRGRAGETRPERWPWLLLCLLCVSALSVVAVERAGPTVERAHPSGLFSFRTPPAWSVEAVATRKDLLQASGEEGVVWFVVHPGNNGYDSQHVNCMSERLVGKASQSMVLSYEYDFREGAVASRRALDSAFLVAYTTAVRGQAVWRQRNVTLVGDRETVCVVVFCPAATWKASKQTRLTLDAVVGSIAFPAHP
jgi:hypothetical protein